jgi:hypothetical protein
LQPVEHRLRGTAGAAKDAVKGAADRTANVVMVAEGAVSDRLPD